MISALMTRKIRLSSRFFSTLWIIFKAVTYRFLTKGLVLLAIKGLGFVASTVESQFQSCLIKSNTGNLHPGRKQKDGTWKINCSDGSNTILSNIGYSNIIFWTLIKLESVRLLVIKLKQPIFDFEWSYFEHWT